MVSLNRRKHALYIQLTGLLSAISLGIVFISIGTQDWIHAIAIPTITGTGRPGISNINYGLFGGTLIRRTVYSPYQYDLYVTCIWGENSCAWSCAASKDSRETEVRHLLDGKIPKFLCIPEKSDGNVAVFKPRVSEGTGNERIFTNAGLWVTTIIFLVMMMIALVGSVVLSIINCTNSPIETYLNVQGIYLANAIALIANFFVLLMYGISFDAYIKKDISIFDTLVGDYKSESWLQYSYWILLLPFILEAVGIFLIAWRERMVNSDRAETKIDIAIDTPALGVMF